MLDTPVNVADALYATAGPETPLLQVPHGEILSQPLKFLLVHRYKLTGFAWSEKAFDCCVCEHIVTSDALVDLT